MFYNLIIAPIETIVDWVFNFITIKFSGFGIIGAVCGVSLVINFLALPLYNIADSLQEKERKIAKALEPRVKRIKKAFKGNEQFMMLSTYYRENNYHPLYVLRSSLSILIEIPFFIAAYHYLSNCEALKGSSFWIFRDLGSPDGLLHIGSFPVHVLPIVMTLINFVSGAIYTKEAPFREKIQLYLVAGLFLVLLYSSPSGLVIYWILNNIFSLVKNIVMKMKNPGRILHGIISLLLLAFCIICSFKVDSFLPKIVLYCLTVLIIACPYLLNLIKELHITGFSFKPKFTVCLMSGISLSLLAGFILPSSVISTSVTEFSYLGGTANPVSYVWSSLFVFMGLFVFWPSVIYKMFGEKVKAAVTILCFSLFISAFTNSYIFKFDYGLLNISFNFDNTNVLKTNSVFLILLPIIVFFSILFLFIKYFNKYEKITKLLLLVFILAETGYGGLKTYKINAEFNKYSQQIVHDSDISEIDPIYHLSKSKKNVVFIFLDRAIASFVPHIMDEFPELKTQFKGFKFYPNTLSFSDRTITGTPGMLGGYDYCPENINLADNKTLREKHNEASLLLPKIFSESDYKVTVTNPPYPNYSFRGDFSQFESLNNTSAFDIFEKYSDLYLKEKNISSGLDIKVADKICRKEIRNFSVVQILMPKLRYYFYKFSSNNHQRNTKSFIDVFSSLYYSTELTDFTSDTDNYIFIGNDTPHEPLFLDYPNCEVPSADNSNKLDNYTTSDDFTIQHYHINIAVLKQVGRWLNHIQKNNAYDNTRIIIVSDHGKRLPLIDFNNFNDQELPSAYNALLLYKDFNSNAEFSLCNEFMTNADTVNLLLKDLDISRVNPYTDEKIKNKPENGINVFETLENSNAQQYKDNKQFKLDKNRAFHVSDNIFDPKNWIPLTEWEKMNGGDN